MTALCAVLACAWIGVNASEARSIARYRAILSFDLPRMKDAGYAYEQLAAYYRERRNTQEEIRMLERAVAASANPRYRVTLGMRYYFVGEKNRGIELLEQSLRSDPSSTRARQTLVQMLFFSGRFDEVLSLCDEGMRREPSDPFYPYHKGAALDRTGRPGEALDALRRARTLNPPPDMMKQIDALLRRLEPKQ
jgi:tetratricopeptide (TPR) repeat protein